MHPRSVYARSVEIRSNNHMRDIASNLRDIFAKRERAANAYFSGLKLAIFHKLNSISSSCRVSASKCHLYQSDVQEIAYKFLKVDRIGNFYSVILIKEKNSRVTLY